MKPCLGTDAENFFGHKRRKLDTLHFYFIVLMKKVASFFVLRFFMCESVFNLTFFRIALLLKLSRLGPNNDSETKELTLECFSEFSSFFRRHLVLESYMTELLKCVSLLTTSNLFDI